MKTSIGLALDVLDRQYKTTVNSYGSDWNFFLCIVEYIKTTKETPLLQNIVSQIENGDSFSRANLEKYKKQALEELRGNSDILISRIKEEKIDSQNLHNLLTTLKKYRGDHHPNELHSSLSEVISFLVRSGYNNLIRDLYSVKSEANSVRFYTLSKGYELFYEEEQKIESYTKKGLGINSAWNALNDVYSLILDKNHYFQELILQPNVIVNVERFSELTDEMEKIENGSTSKLFQRDKFTQHLMKLHNYLINELTKERLKLNDSPPIAKYGKANIRKTEETIKVPFIVDMNGKKWGDLTFFILQDNRVTIRLSNDETYETDWIELGLTKTREGKIVASVNWDFFYTCAMHNGCYPIKGLSKSELAKAHQWKKAVKTILMARFNTRENPFGFDDTTRDYVTKFKVLPTPKDREDIYSVQGILSDNRTDDWKEQMNEDTDRH